ncbi:hypothetical protein MesoLjLc_08720 [Mesorhizobium sp. L-8-10]|uniref:flavin reductase family protein n=1 Tax=Mesorhizobium sp. L-8-10 TaxID=2744523 RepID=UPI001936E235|nr:flavin reductase family protein [Mesorhizobium sp. L-8-10]BCH28942.1 hypothetical protein MesoLjLc_08720 [Mesorhizobium sp. L-8-10]
MEIRVTGEGGLLLAGDDDFTSFAVAVEANARCRAADALRPIARLDGESNAWIDPEQLRGLAPRAGHPEWEKGFSAMVAYAERKGWVDANGAIRAHIVEREPVVAQMPPVAVDDFKQAMRNLAGGVAIVATGADSGRRGMTVTAVTSVSAEPPCLLVCVNRSAEAHDVIVANGRFSVNLLDVDHKELALRFAGQDGTKGASRFDEGRWGTGALDLPVLEDALCAIECELMASHVVGSHSMFVGSIVGVDSRAGEPLVNFQGRLQTLEAA